MTDKEIIKNAHCKYFEGQTGQCQAKEFIRCNPINCKLYTIDELSTILDLQKQLRRKEQECEELKETINKLSQSVILPMPKSEVINLTDCYKEVLKHIQNIAINERYNAPTYQTMCKGYEKILDIINEVNS